MEFSPREILLIYLIADLNKNFIIHSLASILHVHNFTCPLIEKLFAPKIIFNRCSVARLLFFGKRSLKRYFKKKKKKKILDK